jgi:hypothetical protein
VTEQELGRSGTTTVTIPKTINGVISQPGELDEFRIRVEKGTSLVAEVEARRLNSPLDSILQLVDSEGKVVAENDDFEDKGSGLLTHQADSRIAHVVSDSGEYRVVLRDHQGKGGPEYGYRLRITAPEPDFALRITPSSLNLRPGGSVQATVHVLRKDGFTNEIELRLANPVTGLLLQNPKIPGGQELAKITLSARRDFAGPVQTVRILGASQIAGKDLVRDAEPADDQTQAFSYHHLVPARELKVAVIGAPARGRPGGR